MILRQFLYAIGDCSCHWFRSIWNHFLPWKVSGGVGVAARVFGDVCPVVMPSQVKTPTNVFVNSLIQFEWIGQSLSWAACLLLQKARTLLELLCLLRVARWLETIAFIRFGQDDKPCQSFRLLLLLSEWLSIGIFRDAQGTLLKRRAFLLASIDS